MKQTFPVRSLVAACAAALAFPAAAQQVTFMTGPQGGSWIPLGGALKNMWETAIPGMQIQQTPGAGIANVRGVDEGKAQIGFANSASTVDGVEGRAPFPKKTSKVCQLANLYPQHFQVVALKDANVKSSTSAASALTDATAACSGTDATGAAATGAAAAAVGAAASTATTNDDARTARAERPNMSQR